MSTNKEAGSEYDNSSGFSLFSFKNGRVRVAILDVLMETGKLLQYTLCSCMMLSFLITALFALTAELVSLSPLFSYI